MADASEYPTSTGRKYVRMTLQQGSVLGDLVVELFSDLCPKTCEQVVGLVQGQNGLTYKGSPIHRVVRRGYIQGGDVVDGTGAGVAPTSVPDETFAVKHDQIGIIGLAKINGQAHTAYSQFYITQSALPWMDGKNVAFGKVVNPAGLQLLKLLDNVYTLNERPVPEIKLTECKLL